MFPQEVNDYIRQNAVVSGPTLDMTGTFWRYSATMHGHQGLSDFFTTKEEAREHALQVLTEALEASGQTFPELAPPEPPLQDLEDHGGKPEVQVRPYESPAKPEDDGLVNL